MSEIVKVRSKITVADFVVFASFINITRHMAFKKTPTTIKKGHIPRKQIFLINATVSSGRTL
jgi:hypothetical protein